MATSLSQLDVANGDRIRPEDIPLALTAGPFSYEDGSTQTFEPEGATTYNDRGTPTQGEWYIDDDGRFCSFWPPSYRACYELTWLVVDEAIAGVHFADITHESSSTGRY